MSRQEIEQLIAKAHRSIEAAQRLLDGGDADFSVSRAYYAMFYAAQALLLNSSILRSKHAAVIAAFNQFFVKSGQIEPRFFLMLRDAFEDRGEGDYTLMAVAAPQAAQRIVQAREFVSEIAGRLGLAAQIP